VSGGKQKQRMGKRGVHVKLGRGAIWVAPEAKGGGSHLRLTSIGSLRAAAAWRCAVGEQDEEEDVVAKSPGHRREPAPGFCCI